MFVEVIMKSHVARIKQMMNRADAAKYLKLSEEYLDREDGVNATICWRLYKHYERLAEEES